MDKKKINYWYYVKKKNTKTNTEIWSKYEKFFIN